MDNIKKLLKKENDVETGPSTLDPKIEKKLNEIVHIEKSMAF